jgi:hypothetical protein
MVDPKDPRLLQQEIDRLRHQVDLLSQDADAVAVGRVVSKALAIIRQQSFAVLFALLTLVGYVGFSIPNAINWVKATANKEAEVAAKAAADKYVTKPETRNLLERTIETRVTEIITPQVTSIAVQEASEVLHDVTLLRGQLAAQLKNSQLAPPERSVAFAIYGRQGSSEKWIVGPYFQPLKGGTKVLPQPGEQVRAIGSVFVHTNYPSYTGDHWVNAPLSSPGVIHPNDELEVLRAKDVHDGFVWINFKFLKRAPF